MNFTPLPVKFQSKGFSWEVLKRDGDLAIIKQTSKENKSNFNVIEIQKQKSAEFNGIQYEAKETIPGWEQWGKKAWNFMTLEAAEKFYRERRKYD